MAVLSQAYVRVLKQILSQSPMLNPHPPRHQLPLQPRLLLPRVRAHLLPTRIVPQAQERVTQMQAPSQEASSGRSSFSPSWASFSSGTSSRSVPAPPKRSRQGMPSISPHPVRTITTTTQKRQPTTSSVPRPLGALEVLHPRCRWLEASLGIRGHRARRLMTGSHRRGRGDRVRGT